MLQLQATVDLRRGSETQNSGAFQEHNIACSQSCVSLVCAEEVSNTKWSRKKGPILSKMPAPSPPPKFVYKILSEKPPEELPNALPLSELDAKDGFIHLSTAEQVPATAGRFFSMMGELWLLKIELDRIEKNTRWEPLGRTFFPHFYDHMLGKEEITDIKVFRRDEGKDWTTILEEDYWLA